MFIISGTFAHSTETDHLVILENNSIVVLDGKITFFDKTELLDKFLEKHGGRSEVQIKELKKGQFVIPGFIDTHIHAPQYPNSGKGLDVGLLEWLEKYTFPTESKFKDLKFAKHVYEKAVRRVLRNGTTTACYYGTIHTDACKVLCDVIVKGHISKTECENRRCDSKNKYGQRALIGKVNMIQNSPDYYVETSDESKKETIRFVDEVLKRKNSRLEPILTPRFAVSCDMDLMKYLALLAKEKDIHIQTHISETKGEIEWIKKLYPEEEDHTDYTDVYDKAGLLGTKTVLAHGIYLSERERQVVKERGCGIAHCPNSNTSLRSGTCNVKQLLDEGIKVGLGTDCSGGYSTSMQDAMRCCLHVSNFKTLELGKDSHISHKEAFMMATLGGAKVIDKASCLGNFDVGKQFDALVIDVNSEDSQIDVFDADSTEDIFEKFIYLGNEKNFLNIYVDGVDVLPNVI